MFLQSIGCHVVNMDANTMSEGESHKHLVLGLLWQIISVSYTTLKPQKRKFSTMTINDRQLSGQKIRQKISVIKTNAFDWELFTFDDIKK